MNDKNVLTSTDKKESADHFFIEKSVCPGEFSIAFCEDFAETLDKSSYLYLTTNSKITGKDSGPLQIGGGRGANFTLRHATKDKKGLSIADWEREPCYVKLASRLTQHNSYVGLNERSKFTVCAPKRTAEKAARLWLQFKLERVRNQDSNRMTVYRAPHDPRRRKPIIQYSQEEGEEEEKEGDEIDFAHEFEQVSDSD